MEGGKGWEPEQTLGLPKRFVFFFKENTKHTHKPQNKQKNPTVAEREEN